MSHDSGWQNSSAPHEDQQPGGPGMQEEKAPLIPEWVISGGYLFIVPTALAITWALVHIGDAAGAGAAWVLSAAAACGAASLWRLGYRHRVEASEALNERALYHLYETTKMDSMTGPQFETYCAVLLRARGYRHVAITGGTDDDQGVDITATDPAGAPVAIQCKRWKVSVGPNVIRESAGSDRLRQTSGAGRNDHDQRTSNPRSHEPCPRPRDPGDRPACPAPMGKPGPKRDRTARPWATPEDAQFARRSAPCGPGSGGNPLLRPRPADPDSIPSGVPDCAHHGSKAPLTCCSSQPRRQ